MTAVLSWQVQKFLETWRPGVELQQNEVFFKNFQISAWILISVDAQYHGAYLYIS